MEPTVESKHVLERIHDAIQDARGVVQNPDYPEDAIPEDAALVRFVVVADWMDSNGKRWLQRVHPIETTKWEMEGMLFEALWDWEE